MRVRPLLLSILLSVVAFGQIPTDTLRAKIAAMDTPRLRFLRDNAGSVETLRRPDATHFRRPNGENVAIIGGLLNWTDPDTKQIEANAPELWDTVVGNYRLVGAPVIVRIVQGATDSTVQLWDRDTKALASIVMPKFTRTAEFDFSFTLGGIHWTATIGATGWAFQSDPIQAARGLQTYQVQTAIGSLAMQEDAPTGDLADGSFRLARAVMVGADESRTPCSAWRKALRQISFACDDSALAASAFPYVIDPSATIYVDAVGDDGAVKKSNSTQWPPNTSATVFVNETASNVQDSKDVSGTSNYYRNVVIIRYDTSSLTGGAIVSAAQWNGYVSALNNFNGCSLKAEYHDASLWPISAAMYTDTNSGNAFASALSSLTAPNWNALTLSNPADVVTTGYTALRWSVLCPSAPGSYNNAQIRMRDFGSSYPYLVVTYTMHGPKLIVVSQ